MAVKLIGYQKAKPPMNWVIVEDKSMALDEPASRSLLGGLREHLAVAEQDGDGGYIAIRVSDGDAQVAGLDPSVVA